MLKRALLPALTVAMLAAAPGPASAADTVVASGASVRQMSALDGVVVWITGGATNRLMQRGADGTVAPVPGAPAASYRSLDLGRDAGDRLVLTYLRCAAASAKSCTAYSDDLAGHRDAYTKLVPPRCRLTTAPARWQSRVAYSLYCWRLHGKPYVFDPKRSGPFVRKGAGAPRRVGLKPIAREDENVGDNWGWVDLLGTDMAASASGLNYSGAYVQTINATQRAEVGRGGDEGTESPDFLGASLGAGRVLWSLYSAVDFQDGSYTSLISRLRSGCEDVEVLAHAAGTPRLRLPAASMTVDGDTIYLYVPGTGIVTHPFAPTTSTCG